MVEEQYAVELICNNCRGSHVKHLNKGVSLAGPHKSGDCPICSCYNAEFKVREHKGVHGKKEILLENT